MRTKPYTEAGIKRCKCFRCGQPASYQWNICSLKGYYPICLACDIELNQVVLQFMGITDWKEKIAEYKKRKGYPVKSSM